MLLVLWVTLHLKWTKFWHLWMLFLMSLQPALVTPRLQSPVSHWYSKFNMSRDCANSLSSPSEIFIDCILLTLNTLQQSQLHTLCQKTHNFRPCPYCVDTVKLSSNLFTVGLPHHCSFSYQTLWQYSDRYPSNGALNARIWKKSQFSTHISLYLGNDTR